MIRARCFDLVFGSYMSLLVLKRHFHRFIQVMRLNDLAYYFRVLLCAITSAKALAARSDEGLGLAIEVRPGQEAVKYEGIIRNFSRLSGAFHEISITGCENVDLAAAALSRMQMRVPNQVRRKQITEGKALTYWEGIKEMMHLKSKGTIIFNGDNSPAHTCATIPP
jgi:hypothetical protein